MCILGYFQWALDLPTGPADLAWYPCNCRCAAECPAYSRTCPGYLCPGSPCSPCIPSSSCSSYNNGVGCRKVAFAYHNAECSFAGRSCYKRSRSRRPVPLRTSMFAIDLMATTTPPASGLPHYMAQMSRTPDTVPVLAVPVKAMPMPAVPVKAMRMPSRLLVWLIAPPSRW